MSIFPSNFNLLDGTNGFVINGIDAGDNSGAEVSSVGDVNGDGIDDIIIGAFLADPNGNTNAGETYVVFGSNSGFSPSLELSELDGTNGFVINGIDAGDGSGEEVSSAGDVNGDGIDDIIIGANNADPNGNTNAGETYVVFGVFSTEPEVANPITDLTVDEDADNQTLDLTGVFTDADGDPITLGIQNNSNSDLITTTLDGNNLILDFLENQFGTADITIRATADGQFIDDTFTVTVNGVDDPGDDPPVVANPITDITVEENVANQTIDLTDVFQDIDTDTIELEVIDNTNSNLVTPLLEGDDLTLDFLDNQSGTADITIRATADGQSVDDTFTVTVNPTLETIELFRFRNTTFSTGTYVFVGAEERDAILADSDLNQTFELDGVNPDGSVNPAFTASTESGDDLEGFFRLSSLDNPGTFLFVGQGEYDAIFAPDSDQRDRWERQGFDSEGNDIPEFYLYGVGAGLGTPFNRFQNRENNTFLFAGSEETAAINSDPNLSAVFLDQGGAFEAF